MVSARGRWSSVLLLLAALLAVPVVAWLIIGTDPSRRQRQAPSEPSSVERAASSSGADTTDGARLVEGQVLDAAAKPIAGAAIVVRAHPRLVAASDAAGRFVLRSVPLDALVLEVEATGFRKRAVPLAAGDAGAREQLVVTLKARLPVSGVVVDPEGQPVVDAHVSCEDAAPGDLLATTSDAEGRFELDPEAAGCHAVARHADFGMSHDVVLHEGDDNRLQLHEGASIAGLVLDERGQPLVGYRIGIESYRPTRGAPSAGRRGESQQVDDPEGRFSFEGLSPGRYLLTASAVGRPPVHSRSIELDDGEANRGVRISLPLGGVMFGQVLDGDSREPIVGARVSLDAATMTRANAIAASRTDVAGNYRLEGVPKGPFSLKIDALGYRARVVPALTSEPGRELERDFELQPAAPSEGGTEYSGVGMLLAATPRGVMIGSVFEGGPASRAGLEKRDVVVRIDGEDVSELSVPACVQRLRGPVGTRVSITVEREGHGRISAVLERETFVR